MTDASNNGAAAQVVPAGSGRLVGKTHHFPLRVYFADTDAGQIVHHASYLNFCERARTEMMRCLGLSMVELKEQYGVLIAVRSCELDFRRSARLDDALEVRSTLIHLGGASLHVAQSIYRDAEELVRVTIRLVCMHLSGSAVRLPAAVRHVLQDYLKQETD